MANTKQLRVSQRNLIWAAIVLAVAAIAWLTFGWKLGLAAAAIMLIISEVVERKARAKRTADPATSK